MTKPAKVSECQDIDRDKGGKYTGCGNPEGPKPGYKKLRTRLLEEKLEKAGYDPFDSLILLATDEKVSLEIRVRVHLDLMAFLYPKRKPQNDPVDIPLGNPKTLSELAEAQATIVLHISEGKLSAENGKALSDIIEVQRKAIETDDLEKRLIALEHETSLPGRR